MNAIEKNGVFHCDCGFSWLRGKSGNHNCADGLREKVKQLAAENVAMKSNAIKARRVIMSSKFDYWSDRVELFEVVRLIIETPATDRIVAEAEARGVEKAIAHLEKKFSNIGVQIMNLQWLADSLRGGNGE
ncbi:hypothetical protein N2K17_01560 [Klebsiella michiganensis]|uniref:hypothetical protein n=1 Tax=Klebsiella michiganensis TaxID=1134687 RepID=UPI002251CAA4|nr:hypothetical protein [Klebsiella michiganensis]MCX3078429.1 hypothetical protein [Klebsiella michiganensis]MCY0817720.1 hypothetical protein [Klebsiella michiganensis]